MGESLYLDVYSLFSCGSLGGIIYGFVQMAYVDFIWGPSVLANNVAKVFTLLALVTTLVGALVKNLTTVMSERALDHEASGLLKKTGHPVQLGGCCSPSPTCWLIVIPLQFCFLKRLLFYPSLGCYRWNKGPDGKLTQNGRFLWIKSPWFHLWRTLADINRVS